jgi:hypothetical protein
VSAEFAVMICVLLIALVSGAGLDGVFSFRGRPIHADATTKFDFRGYAEQLPELPKSSALTTGTLVVAEDGVGLKANLDSQTLSVLDLQELQQLPLVVHWLDGRSVDHLDFTVKLTRDLSSTIQFGAGSNDAMIEFGIDIRAGNLSKQICFRDSVEKAESVRTEEIKSDVPLAQINSRESMVHAQGQMTDYSLYTYPSMTTTGNKRMMHWDVPGPSYMVNNEASYVQINSCDANYTQFNETHKAVSVAWTSYGPAYVMFTNNPVGPADAGFKLEIGATLAGIATPVKTLDMASPAFCDTWLDGTDFTASPTPAPTPAPTYAACTEANERDPTWDSSIQGGGYCCHTLRPSCENFCSQLPDDDYCKKNEECYNDWYERRWTRTGVCATAPTSRRLSAADDLSKLIAAHTISKLHGARQLLGSVKAHREEKARERALLGYSLTAGVLALVLAGGAWRWSRSRKWDAVAAADPSDDEALMLEELPAL